MIDEDAHEGSARQLAVAENARCAAAMAADLAALDAVLGDELVYVHSSGHVDPKAAILANARAGDPKFRGFEHRDVTISVSGDSAYMRGNIVLHVTVGDTDRTVDAYFLSVWIQRAAGWQMVSFNSTKRVP
jgi:ketosteroid isomerase-like protein